MTQQTHNTVFISYRRSVSAYIARAIYYDLKQNGYDVFMDVESIDSGQFDTIILRQIEARAHFLIICTPGTFERVTESGIGCAAKLNTRWTMGATSCRSSRLISNSLKRLTRC